MVGSGKSESASDQQSLGDLVALAAKDVSQLIRYEISLAKSELRMDARRVGLAAALVTVSMFVGCLVVVLLCFAYAFGLVAAGIWAWAAFLIVAGTCVLLGALACLVAYIKVSKVTGMRMTRKTVLDDLSMLRRAEASPDGQAPGLTGLGSAGKGSAGPGAPAEIAAGRLPGLHGDASRISNRDQRAMDAPFSERERDPVPRGEQR